MVDNNNDNDLRRHMEAQEQASRTQQEALDNIQCMLSQPMKKQNDEDDSYNRDGEENRKEEEEHTKRSSSIDVEVIKGIQTQTPSLAQQDELRKWG